MDFIAIKTFNGLKPAFDADYEQYSKLKVGESYKIKVTKVRNLQFHRLYFALINCSWAFQNEQRTTFFKNNIDLFRKTVEVAAGHCDIVFSIKLKQWVEIPKSISFDKMDEFEFRELYENVKTVLFNTFLNHITQEEFEKSLINF